MPNDGRFGGAVSFDGVNDQVNVPHHASLNIGASDFSVAGWVRGNYELVHYEYPRLFEKMSGTTLNGFYIFITGSDFQDFPGCVVVTNGNYEEAWAAGYSVRDGKWHHIACTREGGDLRIYVDGVERGSTNTAGGNFSNSGPISIGWSRHWDGDYFQGQVDDIRVYNRKLDAAEIVGLYKGRFGCKQYSSCSHEGEVDYNAALESFTLCNGTAQIGIGCYSPAEDKMTCCRTLGDCGTQGAIEYFTAEKALAYCNGSHWISIGETIADPCACGTASPGQLCGDGTVYVGLSPDGNIPMYTTPADAGFFAWNNGSDEWIDTPLTNCSNPPDSIEDSCYKGWENTQILSGLSDAASPYEAAQYCWNLEAHGYDDWYLPSHHELLLMYDNRDLIKAFDQEEWYWSSSERNDRFARIWDFSDGTWHVTSKWGDDIKVRCVRKASF